MKRGHITENVSTGNVHRNLFLVRLCFPLQLSIVQVIRNRYGNEVVKMMRKFEKLDFTYWKVLLDLGFLDKWIRSNVAPKFVQFRVANKDLRSSSTYRLPNGTT